MTHGAHRRQEIVGGMSGPAMILLLVAVAGMQIVALWWTQIPLGVPGEWTWPRIPVTAESAPGWALATAYGASFLAFVWIGGRRQQRCSRCESAAWLTGLAVVSFVWLSGVQSAVPGIGGLPKAHFVLYYPRSSGYFWQARYETGTTTQFLADYERQMSEGDYLHIGTHPPGLTLCFRGLLSLCRGAPELRDFVLWTQPDSVREAAEEIQTRSASTPNRYTPTDAACVWLAALLVQFGAAATVVPLFLLVRCGGNRVDAWFAAALWPLVPAIAIFLPKSDALFPCLSMLVACLWCGGWRRQSIWMSGLAGLVLMGGLLLSLAFLPVLLLLLVWTTTAVLQRTDGSAPARTLGRSAACLAAGAVAFVVPMIVLDAVWDLNLLRVWQWNLLNHSQFYAHFERTYWVWLLVNPLELCFAVGTPLAVLASVGLARGCRRPPRSAAAIAFLTVWLLVWASGKNMGEAARLWLLMMPWLVAAVPAALSAPVNDRDSIGAAVGVRRRTLWISVAALQTVVCIATVTRIDGFQFSELLPAAASVERSIQRSTLQAAR